MPSSAEFLINQLLSSGVKHIFSVPGDYSLPFLDKLHKSQIEVIGTTTEAAAGFAADAYARVNGLGCVCVTYCVGGFNLVNAIAGAYAEKSPVVVISGSPGMKEREEKVLLHHMVGHFECQHHMFAHITCANTVLRDPERAGYEIDRVLEAAKQHKQPVYIELPRDMVDKSIRYDPYTVGTPQSQTSDEQSLQEALEEVAQWINQAANPVFWAGVEVARFGLGRQLLKLAEITNIPIATTILGKSVVPERHPLVLGVYCESTASPELLKFMESCDCLIMLGVMMTDMNTGFLPLRYQKRHIVLATSSATQVRNHVYQDVMFADFVNGLLHSRIEKRTAPPILRKSTVEYVTQKDKKITIQRLFSKINAMLTSNMTVIADVGDALFGSLDITVHDCHHFISDAFYASMGFSVPAALGVQTADPSLRPLVIVGDGAFQMTGMEFSTLVKRSLNPIIIVLNNGGYGTERLLCPLPYNDIKNWNYEKIPCMIGGGIGFKVETEEELDHALTTSLGAKEATIINVIIDRDDHTPTLKKMFGKKINGQS